MIPARSDTLQSNMYRRSLFGLVFVAVLLLLSAGRKLYAQNEDSAAVCGRWLVDAPPGNDSLILEIAEHDKLLTILGSDSGTGRRGLGIYKRGSLLVAWGTERITGISLYTIGSKSTLYGQWAFDGGDGSLGSERATGGDLDSGQAEYVVTGVDPRTRVGYSGTLNVRRLADAYFFEWEFSGERYHGVGLRNGNRIIVGWGTSDTRYGAGEYTVGDTVVTGRSVGSGSSVIRTERWQRIREAVDSSGHVDVGPLFLDTVESFPVDSLDAGDSARIFGAEPTEP